VCGAALEEERRLAYVALTRARARLTISYLLLWARHAVPPLPLSSVVIAKAHSEMRKRIQKYILLPRAGDCAGKRGRGRGHGARRVRLVREEGRDVSSQYGGEGGGDQTAVPANSETLSSSHSDPPPPGRGSRARSRVESAGVALALPRRNPRAAALLRGTARRCRARGRRGRRGRRERRGRRGRRGLRPRGRLCVPLLRLPPGAAPAWFHTCHVCSCV
jgi:hypothetical protein